MKILIIPSLENEFIAQLAPLLTTHTLTVMTADAIDTLTQEQLLEFDVVLTASDIG